MAQMSTPDLEEANLQNTVLVFPTHTEVPLQRYARLQQLEDSILELTEELADAIRGEARLDHAMFERGARAIGTLVRTIPMVRAEIENTIRDIHADAEKARQHSNHVDTSPQEVENLILESTRRLHAHITGGDESSLATRGEA